LLEGTEQHRLAHPAETGDEKRLLWSAFPEPSEKHVECLQLAVSTDKGGRGGASSRGIGVRTRVHTSMLRARTDIYRPCKCVSNSFRSASAAEGCSQNSLTTRFAALLEDLPQVKRGTSHSRSEAQFAGVE
jgi:hypothetical protein